MVKGKKKPPLKLQRGTSLYAVVKFIEHSGKLFECIPESWFVNEEKSLCFWPPKAGKSFTLRAMIQEIPEDEDWEVYECEVVSEGHATYSIGAAIVREKCAQNYNTSSAEEHQQAQKFRRQHPGLIDKSEKSIEKVFSNVNLTEPSNNKGEIENENQKQQEKSKTSSSTDSLSDKNYSGLGANDNKSRSRTHSRSSSRTKSRSTNKELDQTPTSRTHLQSGIPSESDNNKKRSQSRSSHSESSHRSNSRSRSRTHSQSGIRSESENKKRSQSRSSHSELSHGSKSRSRSRTHSQSGFRSESENKKRSQSRSSHSELSHRSNSRPSSRRHSRSNNRKYLQSRFSHSKSSSRSHSKSFIRSHSRGCSGSKIDLTLRRKHSRSRANTRLSSVSRSRISISSSRSRSKYGSFVPTSYSAQRSHTRAEDCSASAGRYRRDSMTNESIRSGEVTGSAVRNGNGSNLKSRQSSSSIRSSRMSSNAPTNISSSYQYRERLNSNTTSRRNSSICIQSQTNTNKNLHRNDSTSPYRRYERQSTHSTRESHQGIETLIEEVKELKKIVNKNNRRFVQNDQRLTRMEVTVNKSFIMLGDLAQALNTRMSILNSLARPNSPPRGFRTPHLPIMSLRKLASLNQDLKDKKFRLFLINDQKEFCTPSKASDNVIMTAYLKRFISVSIRASIVLKDLKGQSGETLYKDYNQVYLFLIEVMKAGYLLRDKILTNNDVHSTLRVVWGRSKQMLSEESKKDRHSRH